ncbi:MAG: hypothetical protein HUU37_09520 [Bdellovibrionales bacterium]|nr:hypothetical protein [Bdellovibrionales bacterium]
MAAGEELVCYCTTCKLNLRHVIIAHKNGNSGAIAKVRCNTCGTIHSMRNDPAQRKTVPDRKPRAPGEPRKQIIPVEVEWREQLSKAQGKPSLPYAPTRDYKIGDVIEHPTFGAGVVRGLKDGNKFEILFQRDVKTLVHRLKAALEE